MRTVAFLTFALAALSLLIPRASATEVIRVCAAHTGEPFPHFWQDMFWSDDATLAMRADYLRDLSAIKRITNFRYAGFYGILDHGVGVCTRDYLGKSVYNFSNVDTVYDGLLRNRVMPSVERSFMPPAIAANPDDRYVSWYRPNVSPPQTYGRWTSVIY